MPISPPISEHHVRITATDEEDAFYLAEFDTYTYLSPSTYYVSLPDIYRLLIAPNLIRAGVGYAVKIALAWDAVGEYGGAYIRAGFDNAPLKNVGKTLDRFLVLTGRSVARSRSKWWRLIKKASSPPPAARPAA